jgi:SNF2 family DNA or RNA helicase
MELFPYQVEGSEFLAKRSYALLADSMGLGKTAQAIAAADKIGAKTILVICPAIARVNWAREFKQWSKDSREFRILLKFTDKPEPGINTESFICSYEYAADHFQRLKLDFDLVICDESHYLKSTTSNRAKAILGTGGIIHHCKRMWFISGTPSPNNPAEMWPILYATARTKLSYDSFVDEFCEHYTFKDHQVIKGAKSRAIPKFQELLHGFMIRRLTENVLPDLPEIFIKEVTVEASEVNLEDTGFFQFTRSAEKMAEFESILADERSIAEKAIDKLESIYDSVATLRRYTGILKIENTAKLLEEELDANLYQKVVVFAHHRDVVEGIRHALRKFNPVTVYGGTPPEKRQKNIDKFQNNPRCRVFIGNIAAAGTGITLTASSQLVMLEQSWVPGDNAQAIKRCNRIGSKEPLNVRIVSLPDSLDQKIVSTLKRKTADLVKIFDQPEELILPDPWL